MRYGRRFTIEEKLRDTRDLHFGQGLSSTHIKSPERRDRLLRMAAMGEALLTLLGAAAEKIGLERMLKTNTAKKPTHSLFRQGSYGYSAIPAMRVERLRELMAALAEVIAQHQIFKGLCGVIRGDASGASQGGVAKNHWFSALASERRWRR